MNTERIVRLWNQLKQRRIIQIFTGYLAAGWVALEVADQLVGQGIVPDLAYPLMIVAVAAGIPASLIIGWFHGEKGDQKASKLEVGLLVLILLGGVGAGAAVVEAHTKESLSEASAMDLRRIAVLYMEDLSSDNELQHVSDGLTEALIDELSGVSGLEVVSKNGTAQYRGTDVSRDSIARALEAGTLVAGSVEPEGNQLRATLRLIDGESGTDFERTSLTWPVEDLLNARQELATEAAALLRQWLGEEVEVRERRRETESTTAWTLVQRAERFRKDAETRFEQGDRDGALSAFARSDSILAQAADQDTSWVEPVRLMGWNDYRRSRIAFAAQEAEETVARVDQAIAHADRALERESNHAKALELRGTARYWKSIIPLTTDPELKRNLFEDARVDLERAVQLDPSLARAHATLSHLYWGEDLAETVLTARRAYQADAYLRDIDLVLWRLFLSSHDLGQFQQARRWCDEGTRRFPESFWFTQCRLLMLTTPGTEPDIERAWELRARLDSLGAPELYRLWGEILVGGVIGRAGMPDSANRVFLEVRDETRPEIDPSQELVGYEAGMRAILGQEDQAIDLLQRYLAANPGHTFQQGQQRSWWWRELEDHPEFDQLIER